MPDNLAAFVDANVFLEVIWEDKGWEASAQVLEKVRRNKIKGFVSVLSTAIIYFFYSQELSERKAKADLKKAIASFEISDNTSAHAKAAMRDKRFSDFEDALQFYSAEGVAKVFITRNKTDFRNVSKEIEVLTPEEFLAKYRL
jgi:predicted nucleic acid-binding protein